MPVQPTGRRWRLPVKPLRQAPDSSGIQLSASGLYGDTSGAT